MPRLATRTLVLFLFGLLTGFLCAAPAQAQSTFTVNSPGPIDDDNVGDGNCSTFLGSCTLRAAIQEANASTGTTDVIEFSIPSSGTTTISEDITLQITDPVIIDATTAPAYDGTSPAVILDGASTSASEDGLLLDGAAGSEIRGLAIVNYDGDGIEIDNSDDAAVYDCFIGLEPDGTAAGNAGNGVYVKSDVDIGNADGPNVISGNGINGIFVSNTAALLSDNIIGLDPDGNFVRPNGQDGVRVAGAGAQVTIQSSTISGNTESGVVLGGGDNLLTTNVIGLNEARTVARPNEKGVLVFSDNNLIGGNDLIFANVIAGNTSDGIALGFGSNASSSNTVQYNYIGTDADRGVFGQNIGLRVANGSDNTIDGNVVGFNAGGIFVDQDARSTEITRNYVGVTPDGFDIGNRKEGIVDEADATSVADGTKIGLASAGTSNYVSLNGDGVVVSGQFTTVQNNFIGTEGANRDAGIRLDRDPSRTMIGTAGYGNEIVFNTDGGILVDSGTDITIQGNYIGETAAGDVLGNDSDGIKIAPTTGDIVSGVTIGYPVRAAIPEANAPLEGGLGNRIRNNTLDGVRVAGEGTVENVSVRGNIIASNGGIGIDLGPDGATANDFGDTDTGVNNLQNTPEIDQSQTTFNTSTGEVEVRYRVDSEASGEGETYIGTDTYPAGSASSFRNIAFTPPSDVSVSTSDFIVGVATDADGNSSEFTGTPRQLPVELSALSARATGNTVVLTWKTLSESGNDRFEVEQNGPGASGFRPIGTVDGAGTTLETTDYRFATDELGAGTHTFRLRQVDVDGSATLSRTVTARVDLTEAIALSAPSPNPVRNQLSVRVGVQASQTVRVVLYDLLGRAVATLHHGSLPGGEERVLRATLPTLPSGKYFLRLEGETGQAVQPVTLVR
jgi:CSLREA domain-containing protein